MAMPSASAKNVIIDTDMFSDVDDAAALLLGATLPGINLLGVNVNYPSRYSISAASAILAHYGHDTIPISAPRPLNNETFFDNWRYELGEFCSKIAYHWSGGTVPFDAPENALEPVDLYRRLLAEADDASITIVSIGFLDSLSAVLNSTADMNSPLSGRQLLNRKVIELVVMGGNYPEGTRSWNFAGSNASLAAHVINTWVGHITFVGGEVGKKVLSGTELIRNGPINDPVRAAMVYYAHFRPISSWDPLTMLYAANGLDNIFEFGNDNGHNFIDQDGSNRWVDTPGQTKSHFLRLKVSNAQAAAILDARYLEGARQFANKKPTRELPSLVGAPEKLNKSSLWNFMQQFLMLIGALSLFLALYGCMSNRSWLNWTHGYSQVPTLQH